MQSTNLATNVSSLSLPADGGASATPSGAMPKIAVTGKLIRIAGLATEFHDRLPQPENLKSQISGWGLRADLFTFLQDVGDVERRHDYYQETESLAALSVTTYEHWWKRMIKDKTRNMVRKAQKAGVELKTVPFDDTLVRGIVEIYNESPMRQGRRFGHYGKGFETVKREHATFLDRSEFVGAFFQGEMIGFVKLVHSYGANFLMNIISKISHRDKAPTNALIARAVEISAQRTVPYLIYGSWARRSIGDFKRHHGFQELGVTRYYVPLTWRGRLALRFQWHRPISERMPYWVQDRMVEMRSRIYRLKYGS
jgi:hypothetical protein